MQLNTVFTIPYLARVNVCVIVTFILSEPFANKSTYTVFNEGTAVFMAEDHLSESGAEVTAFRSISGSSTTINM